MRRLAELQKKQRELDERERKLGEAADHVAHSVPPTSPSVPRQSAAGDCGKNQLTITMQNHNAWVLGGLAELIHNAADAGATKLDIDFEDHEGSPGKQSRIVLKDNGIGMTHDQMNKMLMFGRNEDRVSTAHLACVVGVAGVTLTTTTVCPGGRTQYRKVRNWVQVWLDSRRQNGSDRVAVQAS
jgi:signal transduction histidine kinase